MSVGNVSGAPKMSPMAGGSGVSLPVAPLARPALRHLPLAADTRAQDRAWRPIYAVWELTLKCDLACRHCGSRAGRARPSELSMAECLDLVRQMAELGVMEVTVIGGEAYLHDDWIEIVGAIRQAGMRCSMTTGGRGLTAERAQAAAEAGLQSASVSLDGGEATHDRLRGVAGAHRAALQAAANLRKAGIKVAVNTQINKLSMPDLPEVLETVVELGAFAWRSSSPSRWAAPRTHPTCCRTCYYADVCRAGCTWTGFSLFGKPGNNPLCHHRALEMRRLGKRERLVQFDRAPGEPSTTEGSRSLWRTSSHEPETTRPVPLVQSPCLRGRVRLSVLRRHLERASCAPTAGRARLGRAARMAVAASLLGMSACGYSSSYGTMGGLDADSARAAAEQAADTSTGGAAGAAGAPNNSGGGVGGTRGGG